MTKETPSPVPGADTAKIAAYLRWIMRTVNNFEAKTGKGGWFAEEMQDACNAIAKETGTPVKFGISSYSKDYEHPTGDNPFPPPAVGADPCPGCRPGVVCRTPKCGRLQRKGSNPPPPPLGNKPPAPPNPPAVGDLTDEQIEAAVSAWFKEHITAGRYPFAKRMRAAIGAALSYVPVQGRES